MKTSREFHKMKFVKALPLSIACTNVIYSFHSPYRQPHQGSLKVIQNAARKTCEEDHSPYESDKGKAQHEKNHKFLILYKATSQNLATDMRQL